ncbi:MAG: putative sugar nucleotidyl transferase [Tepidisphaeraceae bacterium]
MHVVIFEGSRWPSFAPLCLNRPVFMLSTGMSTLFEKQLRHFAPTRLTLWVRPELAESVRTRVLSKLSIPCAVNEPLDDEPATLVSGRTLHFRKFGYPTEPYAAIGEGGVHNALVHMPGLAPADGLNRTDKWMKIHDLPQFTPRARIVESLSDLISWNDESLIEDSTQLHGKPRPKPAGPHHFINDDDVWLGDNVKLMPGCVLDASEGPVVLGDSVKVGANAYIQGPTYIGPHSTVQPMTIIRGGTSIGRLCKVGGEIENSIMLGHSNKGHYGFLGHSYVGKWVNFGAGASTSNLKNTYGEVSIHIGSKTIHTGRQFFGSLIGDHVKLAIGTRLMTGTYVGFCSMIALSGFAPSFVPSLSFLTDKGTEPYRIDKAVKVMKAAYSRRDLEWTEADERILEHVQKSAGQIEA